MEKGLKIDKLAPEDCDQEFKLLSAILEDLGLIFTYDQWSFSPVIRFLYLPIELNPNICELCLTNLAGNSQRLT